MPVLLKIFKWGPVRIPAFKARFTDYWNTAISRMKGPNGDKFVTAHTARQECQALPGAIKDHQKQNEACTQIRISAKYRIFHGIPAH